MADDVTCYILGDEEAFFTSFESGECAEQWALQWIRARRALASLTLEPPAPFSPTVE